jgi:hypothetical protein
VSRTGARSRMSAVELAALTAAAAIVALEVWFLLSLLVDGLARELSGALSDDQACPSDVAIALTQQGEVACLSSSTRLPDGWVLISLGN